MVILIKEGTGKKSKGEVRNMKSYYSKCIEQIKELSILIEEGLKSKDYNVVVQKSFNAQKGKYELFIHHLDKKVFLQYDIDLECIDVAIRIHDQLMNNFIKFINEEE